MKLSFYFVMSFLLLHLLFSCSSANNFKLEEGDLLFQDSDCGPFCDAIEAVTQGINNYNFSHIGLIMKSKTGELQVMEAISAGVVLTPLDSFLNRSFDANHQPKVIVGRLKPEFKRLTPGAITFIQSKMNAKYDSVFDINNDAYYCSELIHLAYKSANNNTPIFQEQPMTFKEPNTQITFPVWANYFKALHYEIPEGAPGLNPGGMSRSPFIHMVYHYGEPSKSKPNQ